MQQPFHNLATLFEQLGLDSSEGAITDFINKNKPVPDSLKLYEAKCWNKSQSVFLKNAIEEDADWAEVVDELNVLLRKPYT